MSNIEIAMLAFIIGYLIGIPLGLFAVVWLDENDWINWL